MTCMRSCGTQDPSDAGPFPPSRRLVRLVRAASTAGIALAAMVVGGLAVAPPAQAQFWFFDDKPKYRSHNAYQPRQIKRESSVIVRKKRETKPDEAKEADRPLLAVVSIEDQHVTVYGSNGMIERADVSTGRDSNPTPTGVFAIIQKERWHESNIYSGAPMPFMQRVTWSGVAMHQGQLPGYPASHGCIRLSGDFAQRWFGMTKVGLRVMISPTDLIPHPFNHASLPVPRTWKVPVDPVDTAERSPVLAAGLTNDAMASAAQPTELELNPMSYAAYAKARAKVALKASEQAEGEAGDAVEAAAKAIKTAQNELRLAERAATDARTELASYEKAAPATQVVDEAKVAAREAAKAAAVAAHEQATTRLELARKADAQAKEAVRLAAEADTNADAKTEALKAQIAELTRRHETVSIMISRKDQKLYVRQALRPVFEVPVTISNPDESLGTHVYMAQAPLQGDKALRWTSLSMPIETPEVPRTRRGRDIETGSIKAIKAIPTESASSALDRIAIPGEVMDQLAELVWAGSSIIVTDHGITHETGIGTDFIVQTKHP